MNKAYDKVTWQNTPNTATPLNASNLNKMSDALDTIDDRVITLDGQASSASSAITALQEGKVDKVVGKGLSTNDYDNTAKGIVDGVTSALAEKVDKVEGKGLSTEDFTTAEKTKLAGISAQANKVEITPVVTEGTTLATISIDGVDTDIKGSDIDVDDELSPTSENPVQNKVITVALEDKADKDGNYEDMAVGQLLSNTFEEDKVPYNFRTSGGTLEIGDREYDTLVGGTVVWNQLVQNGNFVNTSNWYTSNASFSVSDNVGTLTASAYKGFVRQQIDLVNGRKYLVKFSVKPSTATDKIHCGLLINNGSSFSGDVFTASNTNWQDFSIIANPTISSGSNFIIFRDERNENWDSVLIKNVNLIDLTQMFGSTIADYIYSLEQATEGSGVAYFRSLFPKDYYDYNAGQLMSVKALSHKMVGFNQFNKDSLEFGYIDNDGNDAASNDAKRSQYIPVLPNTTYYFKMNCNAYWYDGNKGFISRTSPNNATRTSPNNACYLRVWHAISSGFDTDCINLHWDGERDGEYEAYEEHIYPLDSDLELRGIPKLDSNNNLYYDGDTYESDGTVTRRYGIVDLGSLNWTINTSSEIAQDIRSNGISSVVKKPATDNTIPNILCVKFIVSSRNTQTIPVLNTIGISVSGNIVIVVPPNSYVDATAFKTAMSGVYLLYELATPTTETADTFENPQLVSNCGTEEYTDSRTIQIPVGHITKYPPDLKAKLESAPDSPSVNGDYILRHNNGVNTYVADTKELPTLPTTDGTYVLKATVSSGTATLSWVAE